MLCYYFNTMWHHFIDMDQLLSDALGDVRCLLSNFIKFNTESSPLKYVTCLWPAASSICMLSDLNKGKFLPSIKRSGVKPITSHQPGGLITALLANIVFNVIANLKEGHENKYRMFLEDNLGYQIIPRTLKFEKIHECINDIFYVETGLSLECKMK